MAARWAYPAQGMSNGLCMKFNSPCAFLELCLNPGREALLAESFTPAIITTPEDHSETS